MFNSPSLNKVFQNNIGANWDAKLIKVASCATPDNGRCNQWRIPNTSVKRVVRRKAVVPMGGFQ